MGGPTVKRLHLTNECADHDGLAYGYAVYLVTFPGGTTRNVCARHVTGILAEWYDAHPHH